MLTEKKNRKGTVYFEDDGVIVAKTCAKCNEVKMLNDFTKHKAGLGGRESSCKYCKAGYYKENKESYVQRYENNKEYLLELMRNRYVANKDYYAEYNRKYREANPDKILENNRKFQENNPDYRRNYYENNKADIQEKRRSKYAENPEKERKRTSKWARENPEKAVLIQQRRRARKKSLPDTFRTTCGALIGEQPKPSKSLKK